MSRLGWWELADVAAKLGYGGRRDNLARLVRKLIFDGFVGADESASEGSEIRAGRGERRRLIYLAPSAVAVVAAHARTPEAAAFRRETFAGLAATQTQGLPAGLPALPAPSADLVVLHRAMFELERRVDALTSKQDDVEVRVEKIERRIPEQLRLPGVASYQFVDQNAQLRELVEALRPFGEFSDGKLRGWRCAEMLALVKSGDPRADKLRDALEAMFGMKKCSPKTLGEKLGAQRMLRDAELHGLRDRKGITRWFVVSNATH